MVEKPTFETFLDGCIADLGAGTPAQAEALYTINLSSAQQSIQSSPALAGLLGCLAEIGTGYAGGRPELLFYGGAAPTELSFVRKPFRSAIHKLYRNNVTFNRDYPRAPRGAAVIAAPEIYGWIDDLLRCRLVCKYMDGPEYVCKNLAEYCRSSGVPEQVRDLSTDAGYYAWHFYFKVPVQVSLAGGVADVAMWAEIQVTTQLAEAITALTHGLYEQRREGGLLQDRKWKWEPTSQRFRSAYIGHGLHLLEGMIQTFRDEVGDLRGQAPVNDDPQGDTLVEASEIGGTGNGD